MISTIIPDRPLRWNGIPLFHVGAFPEDFSGRLFFVLGQGLGDHVNGFRILHELKQRFTQAVFIVYADLRWEELVRRIEGIEIGWYLVGLDSGPSHMAASFALPMVVVFVETRVIPFEVRPLSPHALLVVESFFDPVPVPKTESVADAVDFILKAWNQNRVPSCPVCERSMNYVVASAVSAIRRMSSWGLAIDKDCSGASFSDCPREGEARNFDQSLIDSDHDLASLDRFENGAKRLTGRPRKGSRFLPKTGRWAPVRRSCHTS